MSRIIFDETGTKFYEAGVDRGVLYVMGKDGAYGVGVPWNGLTQVTESPSGAEATPLYAGNSKYVNLYSAEEYGATIEAYTYPDQFETCDGSAEIAKGVTVGQQDRATFGLCYRTKIGNDTNADLGYKLHIIYGAKAAPSEKAYQTINDSPEAITFSWELTTTPVNVTGFKPTASIVINSTKLEAAKLQKLEEALYGATSTESKLPTPAEIIAICGVSSLNAHSMNK